jgi:uroporphyrin-III C-methyltransferase/precorrin-2 dehydrogenase/sirohydrochlorin ferrochelatase
MSLLRDILAKGANPVMPRPGGVISLVGAGPGAKDLLTLRALERLRAAHVVFYDRLVDPEVLGFCPQAEKVYVGKEVGNHAWPQERIDAVIVAAALQGLRVVRLKSGDPGIFGRATEELAAAQAHGIPVEIVPGVTAASAAGAALGRSLTERGLTDRVTFATATCRAGDKGPDWTELARPGTTLALYMGVAKAGRIARDLLQAGLSPSTEVEVVGAASTAAQKVLRSDLARMAKDIRTAGITNPAIILIRCTKPEPKAATQAVIGLGSVPA